MARRHKLPKGIPDEIRPLLQEVADGKVGELPIRLTKESFAAFLERLAPQHVLQKVLTGHIDGSHCMKCGDLECLPGDNFAIVSHLECECRVHHKKRTRK